MATARRPHLLSVLWERLFDLVCNVVLFCRELRETLYWLRVIRRCGLADPEILRPLIKEADELTAMLTAGMKRLHTVGIFFLTVATLLFVLVLSSKF